MLVTIDTLRADHVGCYGARRSPTPTLDALATRGVRFATAVAPAPLTLPSHASLMTALDPPRHGVRHNSIFRLGQEFPTLAERLRAAGYASAAFVGAVVLDERFGLARGFDVYDDQIGSRRSSNVIGYSERGANDVVEAALSWLETAPQRFFLWLHFYDPHARYRPPPGFSAAFPRSPYDGEIAFADAQLGRLLAFVDEGWDPQRTLVVATSDHGESRGEHGEQTHSHLIYDATQRVPLIMAGDGLPQNRVIEEQVALVDVAPTILDLAGAEGLPEANGRSLVPLLEGSREAPLGAYIETLATQLDYGWSPLIGIRTPQYKYIRAPQPELYDLKDDPGETRNRAVELPEVAAALDAQLEERLAGAHAAAPGVALSPEEREALESLGYVVPTGRVDPDRLGRVGGIDPKHQLDFMRRSAMAQALLADDKASEAHAMLVELDASGPANWNLRASAALRAGELEDAEQQLRLSIAAEPRRSDSFLMLGLVLEATRRFEAAGAAYDAVIRLAPDTSPPLLGLARVRERLGEFAAAERLYRQAIAAREAAAEPSWRLAALLMEQGRFDEAEELLAKLDAEALSALEPALRLAAAERSAGRSREALERLARAHRDHGDELSLVAVYSVLLEEDGRLEEALALREAALRENPDSTALQNAVAWNLSLLGRDLDRALELASRASQVPEPAPEFLDTLAAVHLKRGEAEAALQAVNRALEIAGEPSPPQLLYVKARALAESGRPDEARAALGRCFEALDRNSRWLPEAADLAARLGLPAPTPPAGPL